MQLILNNLHQPIQELAAELTQEKPNALELNEDEREFLNGTVSTGKGNKIQKIDEDENQIPLVTILSSVITQEKDGNVTFDPNYGIPFTIMLNEYLSNHPNHSKDFLAILASITYGNGILQVANRLKTVDWFNAFGLKKPSNLKDFANQLRSRNRPLTPEEKLARWKKLTWGTEQPSHNITEVDFGALIDNLTAINEKATETFNGTAPLQYLKDRNIAATTAPSAGNIEDTDKGHPALDRRALLLTDLPIRRGHSTGSFSTSLQKSTRLDPAALRTNQTIGRGHSIGDIVPKKKSAEPFHLNESSPTLAKKHSSSWHHRLFKNIKATYISIPKWDFRIFIKNLLYCISFGFIGEKRPSRESKLATIQNEVEDKCTSAEGRWHDLEDPYPSFPGSPVLPKQHKH